MGIVEEAEKVRDFLKSEYGIDNKIYLKQKMIVATLDSIKWQFKED